MGPKKGKARAPSASKESTGKGKKRARSQEPEDNTAQVSETSTKPTNKGKKGVKFEEPESVVSQDDPMPKRRKSSPSADTSAGKEARNEEDDTESPLKSVEYLTTEFDRATLRNMCHARLLDYHGKSMQEMETLLREWQTGGWMSAPTSALQVLCKERNMRTTGSARCLRRRLINYEYVHYKYEGEDPNRVEWPFPPTKRSGRAEDDDSANDYPPIEAGADDDDRGDGGEGGDDDKDNGEGPSGSANSPGPFYSGADDADAGEGHGEPSRGERRESRATDGGGAGAQRRSSGRAQEHSAQKGAAESQNAEGKNTPEQGKSKSKMAQSLQSTPRASTAATPGKRAKRT